MKKVLLGLAALAMVACLASCKKNCDCHVADAGIVGDVVHLEYTVDQLNGMYGDGDDIKSCSDVWEVSYQTLKCE